MDLVNMKSPPREKTAQADGCCSSPDEPAYPYGLRISLDDDSLTKLGITELPKVGSPMHVLAVVEIVSTSDYESKEGGERKSLELQITDMALGAPKKPTDLGALFPTMKKE